MLTDDIHDGTQSLPDPLKNASAIGMIPGPLVASLGG